MRCSEREWKTPRLGKRVFGTDLATRSAAAAGCQIGRFGARMWVRALATALLSAVVVFGMTSCKAGTCEHCAKDDDCGRGLACDKSAGVCTAGPGYLCEPHCRAKSACMAHGDCGADGGKCVVSKVQDCQASEDCKVSGDCSIVDSGRSGPQCAAASNADCAHSEACAVWGRCAAIGGRCQASNDADCARALVCSRVGACSFRSGKCGYSNCDDSLACRYWWRTEASCNPAVRPEDRALCDDFRSASRAGRGCSDCRVSVAAQSTTGELRYASCLARLGANASAEGLTGEKLVANDLKLFTCSQFRDDTDAGIEYSLVDADWDSMAERVPPDPTAAAKRLIKRGRTVYDRQTKLTWQNSTPYDKQDWDHRANALHWYWANAYCTALSLDGQTDWRLPDRQELSSYGQAMRVEGDATPDWPLNWTSNEETACTAWAASLNAAYPDKLEGKDSSVYVRCVRSDTKVPARTIPSAPTGGTPVAAAVAARTGEEQHTPTGRLTVVGDTVVDSSTNLTWQRTVCPKTGSGMSLEDETSYCAGLTIDGKTGWRLPELDELKSLLRPGRRPAIDHVAFPQEGIDTIFSTRTPNEYADRIRWMVDFSSGRANSGGFVRAGGWVRCVR